MLDKENDHKARHASMLSAMELIDAAGDLIDHVPSRCQSAAAAVDAGDLTMTVPGDLLDRLIPAAPAPQECEATLPKEWAGEPTGIDGWSVCAVLTGKELEGGIDYGREDALSPMDTVINAIARRTSGICYVAFRSLWLPESERLVVLARDIDWNE